MTAESKLPAPPYPDHIVVKEGSREVRIPITPDDVDVRSLDQMPLDVKLLAGSDLMTQATDAEFRFAVVLWCRAWHQVPAASLPDDDARLCYLAGLGRDTRTWKRVRKGALRGFVKCSDDRLYHPLLAQFALRGFKTLRSMTRNALRRWQKEAQNSQGTDNVENDTMPPQKQEQQRTHKRAQSQSKAAAHAIGDVREGKGYEVSKDTSGASDLKSTGSDAMASAEFEMWWPHFPRHVGKGQARRAFPGARAKVGSLDVLIAGAKAYAQQTAGTESRFIRHPATWLNGEGWLDEAPRRTELDPWERERNEWWARTKVFADSGGWQEELWGPPPGSAGCRAHADVLAEFGYGGLPLAALAR